MRIEERLSLEAMLQEVYERINVKLPPRADRYLLAKELEEVSFGVRLSV